MFEEIRLGHATNSSSTHSIVLLADGTELCDDDPEEDVEFSTSFGFGWSFFTAGSTESKFMWLLACLLADHAYTGGRTRHLARSEEATQWIRDDISSILEVFNSLHPDKRWEITTDPATTNLAEQLGMQFGLRSVDKRTGESKSIESLYVDHQSVIQLPYKWGTKRYDLDFVRDMAEFFSRSNVAILGGNDNTDDVHPLSSRLLDSIDFKLPKDGRRDGVFCRKEGNRRWTMFNGDTGTRVRMNFLDTSFSNEEGPPTTAIKLKSPVLVDLKITDFCNIGCSFCYQNSTTRGKHADTGHILEILRTLHDMEVFEIAIGGGEPTSNPDLEFIVRQAKHTFGIIPNLTTRRPDLLSEEILRDVGGFAVSVENLEQLQRIYDSLSEPQRYKFREKGNLQYVMGAMPLSEMDRIEAYRAERLTDPEEPRYPTWRQLPSRITLLGFKHVGRGDQHPVLPYDNWLDKVKKGSYGAVGIDTALASEFEEQLRASDIPRILYSTKEGTSSMYWDATMRRIAPSSWCGPEQYHSYSSTNEAHDIWNRF